MSIMCRIRVAVSTGGDTMSHTCHFWLVKRAAHALCKKESAFLNPVCGLVCVCVLCDFTLFIVDWVASTSYAVGMCWCVLLSVHVC